MNNDQAIEKPSLKTEPAPQAVSQVSAMPAKEPVKRQWQDMTGGDRQSTEDYAQEKLDKAEKELEEELASSTIQEPARTMSHEPWIGDTEGEGRIQHRKQPGGRGRGSRPRGGPQEGPGRVAQDRRGPRPRESR